MTTYYLNMGQKMGFCYFSHTHDTDAKIILGSDGPMHPHCLARAFNCSHTQSEFALKTNIYYSANQK